MKILIIANSQIVFGKELKVSLEEKGFEVSLLDFETLRLQIGSIDNNVFSKQFKKFQKLPKVSMLFRMYYLRQILKCGAYDIVNIHYNRWFYRLILGYFRSAQSRLVITTYGSDFYRVSAKIRNYLKPIYAQADAITFTNPATKEAFVNYYLDFEKKSFVCRFGLKTLDYIDKNRTVSVESIREKLAYAQNKIIVTCGYNASAAQQHFGIIDQIESLEPKLKNACQFVFPLTYGDPKHKEAVIARLNETNLDYKVLETFLYENDNAFIKLASDIMINVLTTDSFSGSMQEFLYADNVVITGAWLPYKLFDQEGIVYEKIECVEQLHIKLKTVIEDLKRLQGGLSKNVSIIRKLSSWEANILNWVEVFRSIFR